jgi:hypothetical protein
MEDISPAELGDTKSFVVLVSAEVGRLIFMNSLGRDFADKGYLHVRDTSVLGMKFHDVCIAEACDAAIFPKMAEPLMAQRRTAGATPAELTILCNAFHRWGCCFHKKPEPLPGPFARRESHCVATITRKIQQRNKVWHSSFVGTCFSHCEHAV